MRMTLAVALATVVLSAAAWGLTALRLVPHLQPQWRGTGYAGGDMSASSALLQQLQQQWQSSPEGEDYSAALQLKQQKQQRPARPEGLSGLLQHLSSTEDQGSAWQLRLQQLQVGECVCRDGCHPSCDFIRLISALKNHLGPLCYRFSVWLMSLDRSPCPPPPPA